MRCEKCSKRSSRLIGAAAFEGGGEGWRELACSSAADTKPSSNVANETRAASMEKSVTSGMAKGSKKRILLFHVPLWQGRGDATAVIK